MPNTNCLEDRHCPQCLQTDRFKITATTVFELFDDGTGDHEDVEYDDNSPVHCPECNWTGRWCETQITTCINCGDKILKRPADGVWVHIDEDEDPKSEDYGWVSCSGHADSVAVPSSSNCPKARFWVSWFQPAQGDWGAKTDPPNEGVLGYWCSGYTGDDRPIVCAMIEADDELDAEAVVKKDWPAHSGWRFIERRPPDYLPGDRFPIDLDWMRARFNKRNNG